VKKLKFLVSLTTEDNDYQQEQASSAHAAARRLGVDAKVIFAGNDSIAQSQQLLNAIQSSTAERPDAIMFEPVGGTAMPQVARAALSAGVAWVVLNREVDYIPEFRREFNCPIFSITSDHEEIGRIQGRQLSALLANGGTVLHIQGPSASSAAQQRAAGMCETSSANISVRVLKAQWTEASAQQAVNSWLRLRTSQDSHIDLVAGQDDSMAYGARKAFQQVTDEVERDRWLRLPFTGCDGTPQNGQAWVRSGLFAATIVIPPNTGLAFEMLVDALLRGAVPPESSTTEAQSFPAIESLSGSFSPKARSATSKG